MQIIDGTVPSISVSDTPEQSLAGESSCFINKSIGDRQTRRVRACCVTFDTPHHPSPLPLLPPLPLRSLLLCWSVITTVVSLVTIISRLCVMSPQSQPDRQTDQQSGPVLRDYTGFDAAVTPSLTISDPTQWNTEVMR